MTALKGTEYGGHSPGFWEVKASGNPKWPYLRVMEERGMAVCEIHNFSGLPLAEVQANARLIAEAPVLFEAVLDLLSLYADRKGDSPWLSNDERERMANVAAMIRRILLDKEVMA